MKKINLKSVLSRSRIRVSAVCLALFVTSAGHAKTAADFEIKNMTAKVVSGTECSLILTGASLYTGPKVRLRDLKEPSVFEWNVENVFELAGKYDYFGLDKETGLYTREARPEENRLLHDWKLDAKQDLILRAGQAAGMTPGELPAFVTSSEIETLHACNELYNTGKLLGKYVVYMVKGNDGRGINICLAVRSDLNVKVQMETRREATWFDPMEGARGRLFSRDVPVLIVRDAVDNKVEMVLAGVHGKSMRDRGVTWDRPFWVDGAKVLSVDDPLSASWAEAQFRGMELVVDDLFQRFCPEVNMILAGDFNRDMTSTEMDDGLKARGMKDGFDLTGETNRVTQVYFPKDGPRVTSQLNAILASPGLAPFVTQTKIVPQIDRITGRVQGLPSSFDDRNDNYLSDHWASIMRFKPGAFGRGCP